MSVYGNTLGGYASCSVVMGIKDGRLHITLQLTMKKHFLAGELSSIIQYLRKGAISTKMAYQPLKHIKIPQTESESPTENARYHEAGPHNEWRKRPLVYAVLPKVVILLQRYVQIHLGPYCPPVYPSHAPYNISPSMTTSTSMGFHLQPSDPSHYLCLQIKR